MDAGFPVDSARHGTLDELVSSKCCELTGVSDAARCEGRNGARLVTEEGVRAYSFADVRAGQRVYCVVQGTHFVWPLRGVGSVTRPRNVRGPVPGEPVRLRQLSERPRVFAVDHFVSPDEIAELLRSNRHRMAPSQVGFAGWEDETRTSWTSWDFTSDAAKTITRRTFEVLALDHEPELADAMQVLRYTSDGHGGKGEWYKPHVDWFVAGGYDGWDPTRGNGTNRFATMFLYLSDVEEGGATVFPLSTSHEGYGGEKLVSDGTVNTPGYIDTEEARWCCNESSTALRSKPVAGNAVLFYSQGPDGALDPWSLHGGCPPLRGVKWSANMWIWNRPRPDKSKAKDADLNLRDSGRSDAAEAENGDDAARRVAVAERNARDSRGEGPAISWAGQLAAERGAGSESAPLQREAERAVAEDPACDVVRAFVARRETGVQVDDGSGGGDSADAAVVVVR